MYDEQGCVVNFFGSGVQIQIWDCVWTCWRGETRFVNAAGEER